MNFSVSVHLSKFLDFCKILCVNVCDCRLACRGQKRVFKCASFHSRLQRVALRFVGQMFLPTEPLPAPEFISWKKIFFQNFFFFGNFFPSLSFWSYFYLLEFVRYSCLIFPCSSSGSESVWFVLSDSHSWFGMVDFFRGWVCEHTFCEVLPQFCNWAQLATCFVSLCVWTVFGPCN